MHWRNITLDSHVPSIGKLMTEDITGYISVLDAGVSPPSPEQRKGMSDILERTHIKQAAIVFVDGGFRGAVIRSVITGISLFTSKIKMSTFTDVGAGCRALSADPAFSSFVVQAVTDARLRFKSA